MTVARYVDRSYLVSAVLLVGTVFGVLAAWLGAPVFPFGVCAYLVLTLLPGAALYRLTSREPSPLEALTAALVLSPVLTTGVALVALLAGVRTHAASALPVMLWGLVGLLAFRPTCSKKLPPSLGRRETLALLALVLVAVATISYLPFTRDWWRMRSDAWFHAAVVAEIADFGIPPQDPYAAGLPLQYMWFYHVYVLILSRASGIEPFAMMALINIPALVGMAAASFLFSSMFRRSFSHHFAATVTVLLGMNAAYWLFLPTKLLRAVTGEVRGMAEITRSFSLHPFDLNAVRRFVDVGFNQEFFLDKFMVATALSLGLSLMAYLWYAGTKYITSKNAEALLGASLAAFGGMAFHTALGTVAYGGILGGLLLLVVSRRFFGAYETGPMWRLTGALLASGILVAPYIYSVTHAKTGAQALPFGLAAPKMIGIVVSCALVIFLAAFQAKRIARERETAGYFLIFSTAAVVGVCTVLNLPGANSYDKLPFLVFFPLAVVGGWTIADFSARGPTPRARARRFVVASFIAFAPLNLLMVAGYYHTAPIEILSPDETKVATWARAATPRNAVFIDVDKRVFLVAAGPRRYYLASESYAMDWGYDKAEIERRKRLIADVYSSGPLSGATLGVLGSMSQNVYVLARSDDARVAVQKLEDQPHLFRRKFTAGRISVFEIDREGCAALSREPTVDR
jgi:hypothetical protein